MDKASRQRFADMVPDIVYHMPVLVLAMEERKTKNEKAFMNISLSDGEGTVQANIFGHNTRDIEMCGVIKGKVAIVSIVYRGSGYYLNDILGNYDPEITV